MNKPQAKHKEFLIVGIGASAGGLEALQQFFRALPPDTNFAFIVVVHLDPNHGSLLSELLQKQTSTKVVQITDGMPVEPNRIYVIPPSKSLSIFHKKLHLAELELPHYSHLPIDFFFRSLAQDQHDKAVGIVLSGTGSDGSLGLTEIKAANGLVMVQDESSAQYDGMPKNAIKTGVADFILPPDKMPAQLVEYAQFQRGAQVTLINQQENVEIPLQKIFLLIRNQTGHDFSLYKKNTICRRIERRMQLHRIKNMADYVLFCEKNEQEVATLTKELFIGVTSFFRDPKSFEILQHEILPELLKQKPKDYVLRIWIPGCSTGEEAYSMAIIIQECLDNVEHHLNVQIFGTDINESAIDIARRGLYLSGINADVNPERLKRFFIKEDDSYRIKKSIREMLVFAPHNVIKDPPFTKLDIISCRNLLIYFNSELQKKILPAFHYSLREDGIMVLGPSETTGQSDRFFTVLNKKWKIYRRNNLASFRPRPVTLGEAPHHSSIHHSDTKMPSTVQKSEDLSIVQLVEAILRQSSVPPCAIIDGQNNIVYVHGKLGKYLEPAEGKISVNIIDMVHHGLKVELMTAIRQVAQTRRKVQKKACAIQSNGARLSVNMTVSPILEYASIPGVIMVMFEDVMSETVLPEEKSQPQQPAEAKEIETLQKQLDLTKQSLQITIEELESSNEELKSTNEELQSTNEELQSTNEELETSKEELQSLNEEALSVNAELQSRIDELQSANDDMKNLFDSTQIATLFLDINGCIRRFTPKVKELIKLEAADVGRPIAHFASTLPGLNLTAASSHVLKTLEKHESEHYDDNGHCFFVRILPYRTMNNVIAGVVINFENISLRKKAEQAVVDSEKRYKSLFDFSPVPMWENDFSKVEHALQELRRQGVTDFSEYLAKHPQVVLELSELVQILHINNAAVMLFKVDNIEKRVLNIPELFIRCWSQPFMTQLQAIWDRKDKITFDSQCNDLQGNPLALKVQWAVPSYDGQLNYGNVITVLSPLTQHNPGLPV
ncbi:MAG: chemotaxis protein CheB [Methylobacter sp.]